MYMLVISEFIYKLQQIDILTILTKNLVWEKLLRIILEALPLEKSHWNKLIKLKNHDFSAQTKIISKLNMVLKIFLKIFWYITRICNYNLNDILIINLNYDQRTCFYEWLKFESVMKNINFIYKINLFLISCNYYFKLW